MKKNFYRLLVTAWALIMSPTAIAETAPMATPADAPIDAPADQTSLVARKDVTKLSEGKKVLTGMTIRPNGLEIALTDRFFFEFHILSQPYRLEIEIHDAVNGLEADMIDVNKIGIAKVFLVNTDRSLKLVLFPAEGTPLPCRFEVIDNFRGLVIHVAELQEEPPSTPARDEPAVAPLPNKPVPPVARTAVSPPAPSSVPAGIVPDTIDRVATSTAKSNGYYALIAGESVNRKSLDPVEKKLRAVGLKPDVAGATKDVEVFRLVVASFADRKPAELRRAQVALLTRRAFIAWDGDSYCVCAGSLMSEESARKEQKRLACKGLAGVQIVRTRVPLKLWQVTAGRYTEAREAEKSAQRLSQRGIEVKIVETGNLNGPAHRSGHAVLLP